MSVSRSGDALPVFPFTDAQVAEVASELSAWSGEPEPAAEAALRALARVMRMESKPDPMGYPSGYGYRTIWAVTQSAVVKPNGSWELLP